MSVATGKNWVMHLGNCVDVLPTLAPVDHVITDPPYEAEAHTKSRRSHRGRANDKGGFVTFPINFEAMDVITRASCAAEFDRLVRRWCLIFCQLEGVQRWRDAHEILRHIRPMIWVKPDGAPQFTGDRPGTGYECIEVLHAKAASRWNAGGKRAVYTFNCNSQTRRPDEDHPTPKPLDLMLALVSDFTDEGETILDPFAGSGTTLVAALRLGRKAIGIEKDPHYFSLACDRLRAEESSSTLVAARAGQTALFAGSK